jgi:hypothetical protein
MLDGSEDLGGAVQSHLTVWGEAQNAFICDGPSGVHAARWQTHNSLSWD